jgi:hypothetical protein
MAIPDLAQGWMPDLSFRIPAPVQLILKLLPLRMTACVLLKAIGACA